MFENLKKNRHIYDLKSKLTKNANMMVPPREGCKQTQLVGVRDCMSSYSLMFLCDLLEEVHYIFCFMLCQSVLYKINERIMKILYCLP